jgi:hypothetical protein
MLLAQNWIGGVSLRGRLTDDVQTFANIIVATLAGGPYSSKSSSAESSLEAKLIMVKNGSKRKASGIK